MTAILSEAKFVTANLGGLPEALKLRLADSNKILVRVIILSLSFKLKNIMWTVKISNCLVLDIITQYWMN